MYRRQRPKSCSKLGYEKAMIMSRLIVDCPITIDNRFAVWRRCNSSQISSNNYGRPERKSQSSKTSSSIRRACSQDIDVSQMVDKWNVATETCSKRKVDIFLSTTSSLDESSIPKIMNGRQSNEINVTSKDTITPTAESCRSEKKVTFASDVLWKNRRKMTAETRRQRFHNSKMITDEVVSSRQSKNSINLCCDSINGDVELPINGGGCQQTSKQRIAPVENATDVDDDDDAIAAAERSILGCTAISSAAAVSSSSANMPTKSTTASNAIAKRKLKSCRSRSFHKSLDSSSTMVQGVDAITYAYVKPSKSSHHDVVTMVSLLTSNEETAVTETDAEKGCDNATINRPGTKSDPGPASSFTNDTKSSADRESRSKSSSILKAKLPNNKSPLAVADSNERLQLFRTLTTESTKISTEKSKIPYSWTSVDAIESINIDNSNGKLYEQDFNKLQNQNDIFRNLQSRKEQECWLSFRKMTNKGMLVSFDTILRGLLTPTEYRLRKTELLGQE